MFWFIAFFFQGTLSLFEYILDFLREKTHIAPFCSQVGKGLKRMIWSWD